MEKKEEKTQDQNVSNGNSFDIEPLLQALGRRGFGTYQFSQMVLHLMCVLGVGFSIMSVVFIGYKPPYTCAHVNTSKVEKLIGWADNSTANMAVEYKQCSIQVETNDSGQVQIFSLPCVEGYEYEADKYSSFFTEWDLTCEKSALTELTQTLMMVGQAFGAFGFTSLADRVGRKPVYVACSLGMLVLGVATAFSPNYYFFIFCRVATGAIQQGSGLVGFTMFVELLPKSFRLAAGVVDGGVWSSAMMLLPALAYLMRDYSWRYLQLVLSAFSIYSLILFWCLDESLRWLVANRKRREAERVLKRACRMNGIHYHKLHQILDAIFRAQPIREADASLLSNENTEKFLGSESDTNEKSEQLLKEESTFVKDGPVGGKEDLNEPVNGDVSNHSEVRGSEEMRKYSLLDVLRSKLLLKTTFIIAYLWVTNSLTYYGLILTSASVAGNRFLNFFLQAFMEFPAYLTVFFCLKRFGRRNVICVFLFLTSLSLLLSSLLLATVTSSVVGPITNVLSLLGKYGVSGSFCGLFIFCPELFPTNLRTAGLGISSAFARLGGMVAPYTNNLAAIAPWGPGILFGGMALTASYAILKLPETRGRALPTTIEEMKAWHRNLEAKEPLPPSRVCKTKDTSEKALP